MPEGPEVETFVREVRPQTVGRTIERVAHASRLMARSEIGAFKRVLPGRTIERLDRQGKWMFFRLCGEATLVVHLGMTGRLAVAPAKAPRSLHTHLRLVLSPGGEELRFSDPRRFGALLLCGPATLAERFGPARLGPDVTRVTVRRLADVLGGTRRRLKAVLLDQRAVAGIGNIYADEILFEARLNPARIGAETTREEIERLHKAMRRVIGRAIRHCGTTIRDYVTAGGAPGGFRKHLKVYGRADLACKKCAARIELARTVVTGRATYWCPACQV